MNIKFTFEQVRQIERDTHPMHNGSLFPDYLDNFKQSNWMFIGSCTHENTQYNVYAIQWGVNSSYQPDLIVTRVDSYVNEFIMAEA